MSASALAQLGAEYVVDFPTLGDVLDGWLEQHARVPDKFHRGDPFKQSDWQFWCTANHYRIRDSAEWRPEEPLLAQAFVYRRSQVMAPQKTGKGPWAAGITAAEAVGPVVFAGWAEAGDGYACSEHGCSCGWEYEYLPGEPMGMRHPSPLIQLTANSEDQVGNVWRPLTAMIRLGPLGDLLAVREDFIRILGGGGDDEGDRIDAVSSSARSRIGNPISFALQDETGLWTKTNKMIEVGDAQKRGAAGMSGRTLETTNCYNPAEGSYAQQTQESLSTDIFRFYRKPPEGLSYRNKEERRRIHRFVYFGSPWVDLDDIEGTAAELMQTDPSQAERFFGNRLVAGSGSWLQAGAAEDRVLVRDRPKSEPICLGFDGSDSDDWTAIRAITFDQHLFTPTFPVGGQKDRRTVWNPKELEPARVPREEVLLAFDHLFATYDVVRCYMDPPDWGTELSYLQGRYGNKVVVGWETYRIHPMHSALERFRTALTTPQRTLTIDADPDAIRHLQHAVMRPKPGVGNPYIIGKPSQKQKIDITMSGVLAHEAVLDAIAADDLGKRKVPQISRTMFGWN